MRCSLALTTPGIEGKVPTMAGSPFRSRELYRWLHGVEHCRRAMDGRPVSEASRTSEGWGGYAAPAWAQRLADQAPIPRRGAWSRRRTCARGRTLSRTLASLLQ